MEHKDELQTIKRFMDLSRMASRRGIVTFSNFLNTNELNLFYQEAESLETGYQLSGGYAFAERQMIAFIPDALYYGSFRSRACAFALPMQSLRRNCPIGMFWAR